MSEGLQIFTPTAPDDSGRRPPAPPVWARGEAIQPLTTEVLIKRSLELSSSAFLTIISIIQGVALGLLAQETFDRRTLLVGFQSGALLLVLVTVFYFYMTLGVFLRWAPSFLDAFLPFAIGGLEIPPAFFLGRPGPWSAWLSAFWFFTLAGLFVTRKWAPASHFGGDLVAHRMMHRLLWELELLTAAGGVLSAAAAVLPALLPRGTVPAGAGVFVVVAIVAGVVASIEKNASRIHRHFGVSRPAFN